MPTSLFDKSAEYDALLNQGLRLTGENKYYFARGRIRDLRAQLGPSYQPGKILDFGCGIGDTAFELAQAFPGAEVVGVDSATSAIRHARAHYGAPRLSFMELAEFQPAADFDLCYCSGVFHHIAKPERTGAIQLIWRALNAHGRFALFENNPWNPGTRIVMKRIPFDSDAEPLSPPEAMALMNSAGWESVKSPRFLFYFPRWLSALRSIETHFARLPLGGQYYILASKALENYS